MIDPDDPAPSAAMPEARPGPSSREQSSAGVPLAVSRRGTIMIRIRRADRTAAIKWAGRVLAAGIGAGLLSLVRYLWRF